MLCLQRTRKAYFADPVCRRARRAAALRTVGIASKDTRLNLRAKVGGVVLRQARETAALGRPRRMQQRIPIPDRCKQLRKMSAQARQFARHEFALRFAQTFRAFLSALRRVQADPDTLHFLACTPEADVFPEIIRAPEHRRGDRPVNV